MDMQQGHIMTNNMNSSITKIPDMICRLSRPGENQINNPETNPVNMQTEQLFTKVNMRPNPFFTSVTLEVTSGQNKQVIVRMMNPDGHIVKLFGWYLLKGTNVTTMNELTSLHNGAYIMDILDNGGEMLFTTKLNKA
jgi:hypothetical protein